MSIWTDVDVGGQLMVGANLLVEQPAARVSQCDGALSEPLERGRAEELAGLLKAVADPVRLQLSA